MIDIFKLERANKILEQLQNYHIVEHSEWFLSVVADIKKAQDLVKEVLDTPQEISIPPELLLIFEAYRKAVIKHPRTFVSAHDGYAILLEEVDELWENIKADRTWEYLEKEALHVGAMVLRFLIDLKGYHAS